MGLVLQEGLALALLCMTQFSCGGVRAPCIRGRATPPCPEGDVSAARYDGQHRCLRNHTQRCSALRTGSIEGDLIFNQDTAAVGVIQVQRKG